MAEERSVEDLVKNPQTAFKTNETAAKADIPVLESSLNKLAKVGGFDLIEAAIEGTQNLNPERKARKKIFLTDEVKKAERADLKNKIKLWIDLLSKHSSVSDMVNECTEKAELNEKNLKQNI